MPMGPRGRVRHEWVGHCPRRRIRPLTLPLHAAHGPPSILRARPQKRGIAWCRVAAGWKGGDARRCGIGDSVEHCRLPESRRRTDQPAPPPFCAGRQRAGGVLHERLAIRAGRHPARAVLSALRPGSLRRGRRRRERERGDAGRGAQRDQRRTRRLVHRHLPRSPSRTGHHPQRTQRPNLHHLHRRILHHGLPR